MFLKLFNILEASISNHPNLSASWKQCAFRNMCCYGPCLGSCFKSDWSYFICYRRCLLQYLWSGKNNNTYIYFFLNNWVSKCLVVLLLEDGGKFFLTVAKLNCLDQQIFCRIQTRNFVFKFLNIFYMKNLWFFTEK